MIEKNNENLGSFLWMDRQIVIFWHRIKLHETSKLNKFLMIGSLFSRAPSLNDRNLILHSNISGTYC